MGVDKTTWTVTFGATNPVEKTEYRTFTSAKGRMIRELDKLIDWATKFDQAKREELLVIRKEVDDHHDSAKGAVWQYNLMGAAGRLELIVNR